MRETVSVIIPVYNENKTIGRLLESFPWQKEEVIVVDGGSNDGTVKIVKKFPLKLVESIKNRAMQMNEGAKQARGKILLFLHADCILESRALETLKGCISRGYIGGCFLQCIDSDKIIYRFIESSGNVRAKLFKIFYGDQAIFVRRDIFFRVGGFCRADLFEDITFSKKLKRAGRICILNKRVYTSARRWEKQGIVKTTTINWLLSLGFLLGIPPHILKRIYRDVR